MRLLHYIVIVWVAALSTSARAQDEPFEETEEI